MTRQHLADALIYASVRHGKQYRARCFELLARITWSAWYRARPWDPPYLMRFGSSR